RTGSIVLPSAILAGAILVRKIGTKSLYLTFDIFDADIWWLAPEGDPRQGPLMIGLVAAAAAVAAGSLAKRGEPALPAGADVDASFKRYLPFSNLFGLAPIDRWAVLLWQTRLRIGVRYLPRLVVSLLGSLLTTVLALPERLIAPLVLRRDAPPPVFIVGMPRSGTTHLHNLLALDPQFRSPRNYEVFNPHGFLTGWLTTALLTPFLSWRRPMDAVQMTVCSAQEEEFALAMMGSPSPYWAFCLPREISRHDRYWRPDGFSAADFRTWRRHYRLLLRKLCVFGRRTPLLKNPANTGRVALLRQVFPGAKFIHIVRNPQAVWQSNMRLAEHGFAVFQLQDPVEGDNYASRLLANYRAMTDAFYADTADLPACDVAEVRFEDLEADASAAVAGIYDQLGLSRSERFDQRLRAYLERVSSYKKNTFAQISEADAQAIDAAMGDHAGAWGFGRPASTAEKRAA
ncbi:MAG: sulfotransferase, partial [Planctomycetota bacterium]